METFIILLVLFSVLSVVVALLLGIASMLRGGEFNEKYGNKLMMARVGFQGLALVSLALLWFVAH